MSGSSIASAATPTGHKPPGGPTRYIPETTVGEWVDEQQPDEEWVDDRSALRRAWDRVVNWWNWDRPDWDDVKNLYYRVTGTEPYMDPEIDAIILRIAPQLADDAMPSILRHDPHKFGGVHGGGRHGDGREGGRHARDHVPLRRA